MIRKLGFVFLIIFYFGIVPSHAQAITTSDIKQLIGEWKGSLTYMDYASKKEHSMTADLKISQNANPNQLILINTYPNEPKANSIDTLSFTNNGRMIGKGLVISKTLLPNGTTEIVTEHVGVEGNENKPARIRYVFIFGNSVFVKRKEVQFEGEREMVKRHEYNYNRK